jgi:hypothetical protein
MNTSRPLLKVSSRRGLLGVVHQLAGLHQRLAQVHFEFLAEVRQFLAVVGVDHFQPQAAAHRKSARCSRITLMRSVSGKSMKTARPLARENQLGETLAAHQALGAVFFGADKFGAGAAGLGLGVAGHVQARGVVGDLGTDFAFETGRQCIKGCSFFSWRRNGLALSKACHENRRMIAEFGTLDLSRVQ